MNVIKFFNSWSLWFYIIEFFLATACDESNSCDFSACYDDIEFTKVVVDDVSKMYCIDMDSIHMSGISNGGMFMYYAGTH